jgi:hypothetical protein
MQHSHKRWVLQSESCRLGRQCVQRGGSSDRRRGFHCLRHQKNNTQSMHRDRNTKRHIGIGTVLAPRQLRCSNRFLRLFSRVLWRSMFPSNGLGVKQKYMQFLVVLLVVEEETKMSLFVCVCVRWYSSRELFRCASYIYFYYHNHEGI